MKHTVEYNKEFRLFYKVKFIFIMSVFVYFVAFSNISPAEKCSLSVGEPRARVLPECASLFPCAEEAFYEVLLVDAGTVFWHFSAYNNLFQ
jgi:hypothetical protein